MVELATTFVVVESKDTEIVTKADRLIPMCRLIQGLSCSWGYGADMLRLQWAVLKAMWCCGRGSRCVVVETDARLKQGSRVLKVAFSTLLFKLVDFSIIKAVLVKCWVSR